MSFTPILSTLVFLVAIAWQTSAAQWRNASSKDEMTGERRSFAQSPETAPTHPMGFPYEHTVAWLGFGCDKMDEWVYVGFSQAPNLTNTSTRSGGYSTLSTRVKWDDSIEVGKFSQKWGDAFLHFDDDSAAASKLMNAKTLLLELAWYGASEVYFRFSLSGASAAIKKARVECHAMAAASPRGAPDSRAVDRVLPVPDQFFFDFQVERQVRPSPTNKAPPYPPALCAAGIEGSVTVQFVVDTAGRADSVTFRSINETHPLFTSAVRAHLPTMLFFPAEIGSRKVPQLVQMPFSFTLGDTKRAAGCRAG